MNYFYITYYTIITSTIKNVVVHFTDKLNVLIFPLNKMHD